MRTITQVSKYPIFDSNLDTNLKHERKRENVGREIKNQEPDTKRKKLRENILARLEHFLSPLKFQFKAWLVARCAIPGLPEKRHSIPQ